MPTFINRTSVAANSTALPLQGSLYEFSQWNAVVDFSMVQQSGAVGDILATVNSGPDTLMEEAPISAAARFPVNPDDYFLKDVIAQQDRMKIQLRNTTAGAIVVVTVLQIQPM